FPAPETSPLLLVRSPPDAKFLVGVQSEAKALGSHLAGATDLFGLIRVLNGCVGRAACEEELRRTRPTRRSRPPVLRPFAPGWGLLRLFCHGYPLLSLSPGRRRSATSSTGSGQKSR